MSAADGERRLERASGLEGEQLEAVMASRNAVVAAGAGSGKTTVLAARYLRLLSEGRMPDGSRVRPRNLLVLTFTRKAAAEMYSRIYGSVAAAAAGPAAGQAADPGLAEHLADCLDSFGEAQISTFDSFAARIARSGCARYGMAPDFSTDDERARELAADLALAFLLEKRGDPAAGAFVSAYGLTGAVGEVLGPLAAERMPLSSPPDFAHAHGLQGERLAALLAEAGEALLAEGAAALEYASAATTPTSAAWLQAFSGAGEGGDALAALASALSSLRKPSSASRDEASRYLNGRADAIKAAAARYASLAAASAAHPGLLGAYRLLDEFRARWDSARRAEKILSFGDVARMALDLLRDDLALRAHYKRLYRFAMIDEFQDDDELQKRVLYLVAERADAELPGEPGPGRLEPDKLFFVGDEKQSIYMFRGADVSVFRSLSGELAGRPLALSRNFRSEPALIDALNRAFPSIMAPQDPAAGLAPYEAGFETLASRAATEGVEPAVAYLELSPDYAVAPDDAVAPDAGDASGRLRPRAEREAWAIAELVRGWVDAGEPLVADRAAGRARAPRYDDFAILLRSTGNQVHFEKYLRLLGVPYAAESACGLFSEAVACDLYYALRLAVHPSDANALAAYLRSPFAGLSDDGVVRLSPAFAAPAADGPGPDGLPAALREEARALVPRGDLAAWERGRRTMRGLAALIDRAPIARCLSFLWYESGYRSRLLADPVAGAFEDHFELVHSLAARADARGARTAAFVASLELSIGAPDKIEAEAPRDGSRGLRIMTIHKSKGLEFPIVIVPQANNVGPNDSGDPWIWTEGLGPAFRFPEGGSDPRKRINAFFEEGRAERESRTRAELKRLLYVALTRAESHIVVTACAPAVADGRGRSFRSLLARPFGLFSPPSPLAPEDAVDAEGTARPAPDAATRAASGPLAALRRLPSGALVGKIRDRTDAEYFALVRGARGRRAAESGVPEEPPAAVERGLPARDASVTALVRDSGTAAGPEEIFARDELAPPAGMAPEAWGILVHAIVRGALERGEGAGPAADPEAEAALEELSPARRAQALATATALAARFRRSALGSRAFAAKARGDEVLTEWEIAIGYGGGAGARAGPARRAARGRIDLAFVEDGRVVVVDFKTDAALAPGRHEPQLAVYARAASEITRLPAEAWLYYFYGGTEGRSLPVDPEGWPEPALSPGDPGAVGGRFDPRFGPAQEYGGSGEGER